MRPYMRYVFIGREHDGQFQQICLNRLLYVFAIYFAGKYVYSTINDARQFRGPDVVHVKPAGKPHLLICWCLAAAKQPVWAMA